MVGYPAVSSVFVVKSHTEDEPCPLCPLDRKKNISVADYVYSVEIHSQRMGNLRYVQNLLAIRSLIIYVLASKYLGMREGGMSVIEN